MADEQETVIIGKDSPFVRKTKPFRIKDKACEMEHFQRVVIDDSVTEIGYGAFSFCTQMTGVKISGSVARIGMYAFEYCAKLSQLEIGEGVKEILCGAFQNCPKLTSIVIPASVTKIDEFAFRECPNLCDVKIVADCSQIRIAANAFEATAKLTFCNENNEIANQKQQQTAAQTERNKTMKEKKKK